ncbi:Dentin sialophosphoprotein-like [Abeliophyllum distichum]|uniref:Dentin sialophosphoprotein-like n=1 Tax=Abeliophyllum distichum TaxID=126358 RepID=A0ABD1W011_9LAMI
MDQLQRKSYRSKNQLKKMIYNRSEGCEIAKLPDQIPSGDAISDSPFWKYYLCLQFSQNCGPCSMSGITEDLKEQSTKSELIAKFSASAARPGVFTRHRGYVDLSPNGHVQFVSSKDRSIENAHEQAPEAKNFHEHERRNSDSFSVIAQVQCDDGESSFSASGFTTYSGPIAYSRSLSVQSDSSTTSTQFFTFPV